MKKTLLTLLAGLLSTSLFAQELPKVSPEYVHWITFGQHPELGGQPCITNGYDTDEDGREDTRFHYRVLPMPNGAFYTQLDSYAVDENRNGLFEDDEWVPYIREEENGGIDLQEPGNRRDVSY